MKWTLATVATLVFLLLGISAWNPRQTVLATTFDVALNNCIINLPTAGGICDETALTGSQTIAATILINKPVKILMPISATITCSPTSGDCIDVEAPAEIICGKPSFSLTGSLTVLVAPTTGTWTVNVLMPSGGSQFSASGTTIDGCLFYGNATRTSSYGVRINNTYHVIVRNSAFDGEDIGINVTTTLSALNGTEDSVFENLTFNNDAFGIRSNVSTGGTSTANYSWKNLQFNLVSSGDIGMSFESGSLPYFGEISAVKVWNFNTNTIGMSITTDMTGVTVSQMNCESNGSSGSLCVNSNSGSKMPTFFELSGSGWGATNPFVFGIFDSGTTGVTQFSVLGSTLALYPLTFSNLGTGTRNGTLVYCSDCKIQNPCAGSGSGAIAKRLNGAWVCN